ncbi:PglL family O-oligosaccharyltransferase [Roseateles chitosanitabidus]|jgi:O-antigen ligase|uniref:PglL family O-oligosaccharyltransferase n=1 Tax=Roseateles chitosanitabidus TaxID=65048 RepID=UPI00082B936B|nr:O-antigen ligase family protein [Roseateles chitosanitabidus]MBO9686569.1 O-antigen ligase C-terminal domain-containing protein [Roseateles chitosanitabidus]
MTPATTPAADFHAASADALATESAPHRQGLTLLGLLIGVMLAPLVAYNQTPSATIYNQLAAFAGLGLIVAGLAWGRSLLPGWRVDGVSLALTLMTGVALAAPVTNDLPWPMALTSAAMLLGALVAVQTGRAVAPGLRDGLLTAFCVALMGAGLLSVIVSVVQMFFPSVADGILIARTGLVGRAVGNMRQPNHLASLLMWACVASVWLAQGGWLARRLGGGARGTVALYALLFLFVFSVLLSASRTGMIGVVLLAVWGAFDRRLAGRVRVALGSTLVMFAIGWVLLDWYTELSHHAFGAQSRVSEEGAGSPSRIAILKNAAALLMRYPLTGSGWGDFNLAWTMTPFPDRPVAFFDHTHNLVVQLLVEMGLPLGGLTLALLTWGLWRSLALAWKGGAATRCAFMLVAMIGLHSMSEYPLWYAYFLLPAALAFGLSLAGSPTPAVAPRRRMGLAVLGLVATLLVPLVVVDYLRIVHIYAPPAGAASLEERISAGQRSPLFSLQADYAEATVSPPGAVALAAARRTGHHLIDSRLMIAWAKSLDAVGETDKARYLVQRLKEFHKGDSAEWLEECAVLAEVGAARRPFQCEPPSREYSFREMR